MNKNVLNVWVRDLQKGGKDRQVTSDQKRGIREYLWQYDNAHILYIQDKDGDENNHLYQTDIASGETKDLTPIKGVKVELVDADPSFPDEMLIQMNQRDPTLFDVYRLNLQTGHKLPIPKIPAGSSAGLPMISSKSAFAGNDRRRIDLIRVRDNVSSPWRFSEIAPLGMVPCSASHRITNPFMS